MDAPLGNITDKSGMNKRGQADCDTEVDFVLVVNGDRVDHILNVLARERARMRKKQIPYHLMGPNSNSFFNHLLKFAVGEQQRDIAKQRLQDYFRYPIDWALGTYMDYPKCPGIGDDPWVLDSGCGD